MNAVGCSFTIISMTFSYCGGMLIGLWPSGFMNFGTFGIFHACGNSSRDSRLRWNPSDKALRTKFFVKKITFRLTLIQRVLVDATGVGPLVALHPHL